MIGQNKVRVRNAVALMVAMTAGSLSTQILKLLTGGHIAAGIMIALTAAGLFTGAYTLLNRTATPSLEHEHVWGMWEDCTIRDWRRVNGESVAYSRPGQKRECFGCGERQARKVTPTNV